MSEGRSDGEAASEEFNNGKVVFKGITGGRIISEGVGEKKDEVNLNLKSSKSYDIEVFLTWSSVLRIHLLRHNYRKVTLVLSCIAEKLNKLSMLWLG